MLILLVFKFDDFPSSSQKCTVWCSSWLNCIFLLKIVHSMLEKLYILYEEITHFYLKYIILRVVNYHNFTFIIQKFFFFFFYWITSSKIVHILYLAVTVKLYSHIVSSLYIRLYYMCMCNYYLSEQYILSVPYCMFYLYIIPPEFQTF